MILQKIILINLEMKKIIVIFSIVCFSLNLSFGQKMSVNTSVRKCPSFSMYDINNRNLSLKSLENKVIVLNSIGYINIQPKNILEEFVNISDNLNKNDFVFIALTGDGKKVPEYTEKDIENVKIIFNKSNYHLVIVNDEEYRQIILLLNKFPAVPINMIINRKGNIVYSNYGLFTVEELENYKKRIFNLKK